MLKTQFLAENSQLRTVASGSSSLKQGDSGQAVKLLQVALLHAGIPLPDATGKMSEAPHGRYDAETVQAIRRFQTKNSLQPSGVADAGTLTKIDRQLQKAPKAREKKHCTTGQKKNATHAQALRQSFMNAFQNQQFATSGSFGKALSVGGITLPTGIRRLTSTQESIAKSVFGNSLNLSLIFISNATGLNGSAYTVALSLPIPIVPYIVVLNVGTFSPSRDLLIHELAHAWQSQHHPIPYAFMVNSVHSKAVAGLVSGADEYSYIPGKSFGEYAAEQIASQVEMGVTAIVNHVASVFMYVPDRGNIQSLLMPRYEIVGAPGVVTP